MSQIEKPHILFIDSGFKYYIEDNYKQKSELLSQCVSAHIVTFGTEGVYQFGNFTIKVFRNLIQNNRFPIKFPIYKAIMSLRNFIYATKYVYTNRKGHKPVDLIVTYDPLTTGVMGAIVSKLTGVPLIVELNGDYTAWANYAHLKSKSRQKIRRSINMRIARVVLGKASGIKLLYERQLDNYMLDKSGKSIRVFPNYLDVKNFRSIENRKVVSIVGFPFEVKGIDIAIEAFKLVADQFPDWRLEILGYYPKEQVKKINEYIGKCSSITRLDPVARTEMPDYIGRTGIVLCASRTEGFPRVIKEAMQAGKACIASDVGGLARAFDGGKNGVIFQSESIEDLAEKLSKLLEDEKYRVLLGKNAHEFATREYSDKTYVEYANEFFLSVMGKGK